jgi:hypothetical protein
VVEEDEAEEEDEEDEEDDEEAEASTTGSDVATTGAGVVTAASKVGELMRSRRTTSSQCSVCGNMSTAMACTGRKGVPIIVFDSERHRLQQTKMKTTMMMKRELVMSGGGGEMMLAVGRRGAVLCEVDGQDLLVARDVDEALQSLALPHGLQHVGICQDEPETLVKAKCAHHNTTHHHLVVVQRGMKEQIRSVSAYVRRREAGRVQRRKGSPGTARGDRATRLPPCPQRSAHS